MLGGWSLVRENVRRPNMGFRDIGKRHGLLGTHDLKGQLLIIVPGPDL